jgi:hypothetical protein
MLVNSRELLIHMLFDPSRSHQPSREFMDLVLLESCLLVVIYSRELLKYII